MLGKVLSGKVAIVTGGYTGIGLEISRGLAQMGARVILACRSKERTLPIIETLSRETNNKDIQFMELELSSLRSVTKFAKEFQETKQPLHILVNNAGVNPLRNGSPLTEDGFELTLGVNHFGHFLLTNLLLDNLKKSAPSKVIVVASDSYANFRGPFDFDDLEGKKVTADSIAQTIYGRSKLANLLFSFELSRRLEGTGVTVNAVNPGWVSTGITRSAPWYMQLFLPIMKLAFRTPQKGAETVLWLASNPDVDTVSGKFWLDKKEFPAKHVDFNETAERKMWEVSEKMTRLEERLNEIK